jgi:hypothetical protein
MKHKSILISVGIGLSLAVVSGIAISATQDKYTVKVPRGLAFTEFRGYESRQVIAISHSGDMLAAALGNPVMIAAYKAGIPRERQALPGWRQDGEGALEREKG